MSDLPSYDLELKAAEERQQLHSSMVELRSKLRESLDLRKNARKHLGLLSGLAALAGLTLGYAFTGVLVRESLFARR